MESRQVDPFRTETNGFAENAVRSAKTGMSVLLVQWDLSEKWW